MVEKAVIEKFLFEKISFKNLHFTFPNNGIFFPVLREIKTGFWIKKIHYPKLKWEKWKIFMML